MYYVYSVYSQYYLNWTDTGNTTPFNINTELSNIALKLRQPIRTENEHDATSRQLIGAQHSGDVTTLQPIETLLTHDVLVPEFLVNLPG